MRRVARCAVLVMELNNFDFLCCKNKKIFHIFVQIFYRSWEFCIKKNIWIFYSHEEETLFKIGILKFHCAKKFQMFEEFLINNVAPMQHIRVIELFWEYVGRKDLVISIVFDIIQLIKTQAESRWCKFLNYKTPEINYMCDLAST